MSVEKRIFVRLPEEIAGRVIDLAKRADAAAVRSAKLPAGDLTEAFRFESLHGVIDQLAVASLGGGQPHEIILHEPENEELSGPSLYFRDMASRATPPTETIARWVDEGSVVVELQIPHFPGTTQVSGQPGKGPPQPAKRWMSSGGRGKEAVRERFEFLLTQAVQGAGNEASIRPSGISNTVLTESLRAYTCELPEQPRADVPVIYRDGSQGRPFPLRSLRMFGDSPNTTKTLKFALMSIRHVELDVEVDGAWLRNTKISKPRPAGLTDEIVFETSLKQLNRLTDNGPVLIHMYQTGLETAIVGFYRALVIHLLDRPNSVAVVPYFYQARGAFSPGTVWRAR